MDAFRLIIFLLTCTFCLGTQASDFSKEIKRYFKCYAHFVRERLPDSDITLNKVKTGEISGTEACMTLFDEAKLDEDTGEIKKVSGEYNETGKKILKTFNDFHRTWFSSYNFNTEIICAEANFDVYDSGEMAYYLSRSLLGNKNYSSVVTSDTSLEGIRNSEYPRTTRLLSNTGVNRKIIIGGPLRNGSGALLPLENRFTTWNVPVVPLGELVGIKEKDSFEENRFFLNRTFTGDQAPANEYINAFKNFGAGLITTQSYLTLNSGMPENTLADGGMKIYRRWAKNVLNDLLCRDIPVIRTTDAIKYVDPTNSSDLPFRGGISCMQCHATMDPLARTTRNLRRIRSAASCNTVSGHPTSITYEMEPTLPPHANEKAGWIDQADSKFYTRPAQGKFLYRTTKGDLINKNIEGLDDLGGILAETDDLYNCAAKRYLKFLTGVDVPMFDPGDVNAPSLSSAEKKYVTYLQNLGSKLKQSGSAREVIRSIISSDIYLEPGRTP